MPRRHETFEQQFWRLVFLGSFVLAAFGTVRTLSDAAELATDKVIIAKGPSIDGSPLPADFITYMQRRAADQEATLDHEVYITLALAGAAFVSALENRRLEDKDLQDTPHSDED